MRGLQTSLIPSALFICLLILCGASLSKPLFAQENHCESDLNKTGDDPYGYRLRSDRCEGIYIRDVQSTSLLLASLTESYEDFNPTSGRNLMLQWVSPGKSSIHVRAYALRRRLHYRMDTIRPAGSTSYAWPPNLLSIFSLRRNELGVVAWTSHAMGNINRNVYVPLRISQHAASVQSSSYQLTLVPGAELAEVYLSLAHVGSNGRHNSFIQRDQPLGYGYYPAGRGINITIPKPRTPGIYYLEIGATLRAGGTASTKIWFYHPS